MKMKKTFDKDLHECRIGKCTILADANGSVWRVTYGRIDRMSYKANEYVKSKPELLREFVAWWKWRNQEIGNWKRNTPHFRYMSDRGCVAIKVNGARVLLSNGYGDGCHPVYINQKDLPPTFAFSGVSVDGPCKIDVLDYDCEGGKPIAKLDVPDKKSLLVYRESGNTGAVALNVE